MSGIYEELLTATIQHLEDLKAQGTKFVTVGKETLQALDSGTATSSPTGRAKTATQMLGPTTAAPRPMVPAAGKAPTQSFEPVTTVEAGARTVASEPKSSFLARPPVAPPKAPANLPSPLAPEAKVAAMAELRERALGCRKCPHLAESRTNVVFGVGDIQASLMFVGEAPGADEDVQGEPFVGKAGQLLTRIIQTMGFSRETVYIANVLKCRPDTPGQSFGNRKPTLEEMKTCLPYLEAQIDLIQPRVIVALGATAVEGLLGRPIGITRLRGNWQDFRGIPLMPTFHPSFLLRPENAAKKREVWEDMLKVMEHLNLPISEKQRGYFLKPG